MEKANNKTKYADTDLAVEAVYNRQPLEEYNDNPLIGALPDIFDEDYVLDNFFSLPVVSASEREQPKQIRFHMIQRLKRYTVPWSKHKDLERNISSMLRTGYIDRNPLDIKAFNERLQVINNQDETEVLNFYSNVQFKDIKASAVTLTLIGISGIGKTTAIEKLLNMYPQVIHHSNYNGFEMNRTQVVWLKLDCPFDGSLKTFCQSFFNAVDDVLGTHYFEKFGSARNSRGKMMIDMERLATVHSIGIIAIDEMQHLISKKNDPDEILNFLVTLENRIGVPLIIIGTFKALQVLTKELRQSRRAASQKSIIWDRMKPDDEWNFFLETMWELQWLKKCTPLTDKLAKVMYEESQGITAVAVNLFLLAQVRALDTTSERITAKLIHQTAKEDLFMVSKIIKALRDNNREQLMRYDDVAVDINEVLNNYGEKIQLHGNLSAITDSAERRNKIEKRSQVGNLLSDLIDLGVLNNLNHAEIEGIATQTVNELGVKEDYVKLKQHAIKSALAINDAKSDKKKEKL